VVRDVADQVDLSEIVLTHAHFLYSDGAVALTLKRRFGVPFVVAVRNTDINAFMRYRPDLSRVRDAILAEAARVVFLSHAYERLLGQHLDADLRSRVEAKTVIIPNGVRQDWLDSPPPLPRPAQPNLGLLYVGDFSRNKNLPALLEAAATLCSKRRLRLTLVGGGGDGAEMVERLLASGSYPFATHVGRVNDATALRTIYREHDIFVMVSIHETFGVVYAEALSQGLPIVHSRGQGVDGYFAPSSVAEAADPRDPADIVARIEAVAGRLPAVRRQCVLEAGRFDWGRIARTYADLYGAVTREAGVRH
jgi:glycosyltransferase involved in cell wall biosynthesis